ncbi:hypothetical protein PR003_g561 [Phytophthora rubi]|uniref:Secreted protein n=1 Tax=Phytophthora rubi TaxID=129364 RepID=A0A6A3P382_9STRA|nr:hypothetical protein PR002_g20427 [Phytophthora rubi]KAE9052562.1 hypothetical protein PR001_g414 [Phytophthora rubi]KAE9359841.1 hypothetical protein PR003_g561 [Phytophthora rubi]
MTLLCRKAWLLACTSPTSARTAGSLAAAISSPYRRLRSVELHRQHLDATVSRCNDGSSAAVLSATDQLLDKLIATVQALYIKNKANHIG